jgi:hypothetical protein
MEGMKDHRREIMLYRIGKNGFLVPGCWGLVLEPMKVLIGRVWDLRRQSSREHQV